MATRWLGKPLPSDQPWSSGAPDCITEKSTTVSLCTQAAGISRVVGHHGKRWHVGKTRRRKFAEDVTPPRLNERKQGLQPPLAPPFCRRGRARSVFGTRPNAFLASSPA